MLFYSFAVRFTEKYRYYTRVAVEFEEVMFLSTLAVISPSL